MQNGFIWNLPKYDHYTSVKLVPNESLFERTEEHKKLYCCSTEEQIIIINFLRAAEWLLGFVLIITKFGCNEDKKAGWKRAIKTKIV
jgi:hypothetical protein